MSAYSNIFGGEVLFPSYASGTNLVLTDDVQLFWPLPGVNIAPGSSTTAYAAAQVFVDPDSSNDFNVSLPQGNKAANFNSILFFNKNATFTFTIKDYDGNTLVVVDSLSTVYLTLEDNSTTAGEWQIFQGVEEISAVTSVSAVSNNNNLTIVATPGNPITGIGTFTFDLALNLASLSTLASTGYVYYTVPNTFSNRVFGGVTNQIELELIGNTQIWRLADDVVINNSISVGTIRLEDSTISTSSGNLSLSPDGDLILSGFTFPEEAIYDKPSNVLTSDGDGNLIFTSNVNENLLINGSMRIWQRTATFTNATYFTNTDDTYSADQWNFLCNGANIVDIDKVSGTFADTEGRWSFSTFCRFTVVNPGQFGIVQFMENYDYELIDGQNVSLSFVCRGNGVTKIRCSIISWTGSANNLTSDVVSIWGSPVTYVSNWALNENSSEITLSSDFTQYTLEDVALTASGALNLGVFIYAADAMHAPGSTLDISAIKLEQGPNVTKYRATPYLTDLIRCQRFLSKDLPIDTAVFDTSGALTQQGNSVVIGGQTTIADNTAWAKINFPVTMLSATPTIIIYPHTTVTDREVASNYLGADLAADTAFLYASGQNGFIVTNESGAPIDLSGAGPGDQSAIIHWMASSEL